MNPIARRSSCWAKSFLLQQRRKLERSCQVSFTLIGLVWRLARRRAPIGWGTLPRLAELSSTTQLRSSLPGTRSRVG